MDLGQRHACFKGFAAICYIRSILAARVLPSPSTALKIGCLAATVHFSAGGRCRLGGVGCSRSWSWRNYWKSLSLSLPGPLSAQPVCVFFFFLSGLLLDLVDLRSDFVLPSGVSGQAIHQEGNIFCSVQCLVTSFESPGILPRSRLVIVPSSPCLHQAAIHIMFSQACFFAGI